MPQSSVKDIADLGSLAFKAAGKSAGIVSLMLIFVCLVLALFAGKFWRVSRLTGACAAETLRPKPRSRTPASMRSTAQSLH